MSWWSKVVDYWTGTEQKQVSRSLESHEKECALRYKNIEQRLESGSKRFDKLENMIWGVYPFIVLSVVLAKFL
jgi:N-glycosylase/DNA lyase